MENQGFRLKSVDIYNQQCSCNFAAVFHSFRSSTTFIIYNSSLIFSIPVKLQKTSWEIHFLTINMNSASVTDIFSTIVNNNRSRQVLLAGLIVLLTLLLFHNFILSPELKSIKQLKSQILQIENSLIQVNLPTIILKSLILFSLWRKERLLWISFFHRSGSVPNCYAGSMTQFRKMDWFLKNKLWKKKHPNLWIRFWKFDWNWRENSSNSYNFLTN